MMSKNNFVLVLVLVSAVQIFGFVYLSNQITTSQFYLQQSIDAIQASQIDTTILTNLKNESINSASLHKLNVQDQIDESHVKDKNVEVLLRAVLELENAVVKDSKVSDTDSIPPTVTNKKSTTEQTISTKNNTRSYSTKSYQRGVTILDETLLMGYMSEENVNYIRELLPQLNMADLTLYKEKLHEAYNKGYVDPKKLIVKKD